MARRAAVLATFTLAACGRIDFGRAGDAIDAASGHDEDGDGIPDAIDPCPQLAGDQADADGDGVGDACDPNPTTPSEHWLVFATLQPGDQPFDDASAFTQAADSLHISGDTQPSMTLTLGTVRIDLGLDVHGLVGSGQHQIAAGVDSTASAYYFGELNENGGATDAAIEQYDNTNGYTALDSKPFPAFHAGTALFRLDAVVAPSPAYHLVTGWTGELYQEDAATPVFTGGDAIRFSFNGLDADLRYVALIATD